MGRTYRTMNGRQVDMDKLRSQNELTPAVGNMKVNARGDELGRGGKIVRTREQIVSSYYESNPKATPDADVPVGEQPVVQKSKPNNPPSQTMKIEDTPVSTVIEEEPMPEIKTETVDPVVAEEKVLDKGVEAVKKARSRRRGISDATGEK
jgi:hypothetical protein